MEIKEIINFVIESGTQFLLLTGLALFLLVLFIDLFTSTRRITKKARSIINVEGEKLEELENKYTILKSHALSYVNTLGGKGSKQLYELNTILSNQADFLSFLSELIAEGDLDEADRIMKERSEQKEELQWDKRAEKLIMELGQKISMASNSSSNLGLVTNPHSSSSRRESTQVSLVRAKIIPK